MVVTKKYIQRLREKTFIDITQANEKLILARYWLDCFHQKVYQFQNYQEKVELVNLHYQHGSSNLLIILMLIKLIKEKTL